MRASEVKDYNKVRFILLHLGGIIFKNTLYTNFQKINIYITEHRLSCA